MNAPINHSDLSVSPARGYVEIHRRVALIVSHFSPTAQAARLTLRAAALQAVAHVPVREVAAALRDIAAELEASHAGD